MKTYRAQYHLVGHENRTREILVKPSDPDTLRDYLRHKHAPDKVVLHFMTDEPVTRPAKIYPGELHRDSHLWEIL